uniref:AP2/ERF domain-containing protein n=1 Tax=Picea sitchensis TaxID=3332 RepID=A9NK16_PICSI|nr:unknown [Picea sitchensis]
MGKPLPKQSTHRGPENSPSKSRQFKGIRLRKWGKWVSEIRMPNSRAKIWLGSYDSPEKAARAYDFAVYCLRGSKAAFNFPDSPPQIPCASSLSPPQIQAAAARFATEDFRPPSEDDAASSSSPSEAESCIDDQQISAEQGPAFWDSLLLEDLDSGESLNLEDFPPLYFSMDDFGVLFE